MRILSVIPARGGSKGVPRKNLASVAGKPLIYYTIEAAHRSKLIDRSVVSTEDSEISNVCRNLGAEVVARPIALAGDLSTTREVLLHAVQELASTGYYPDAILTLQPTSPLRTAQHIDEAIRLFSSNKMADSLVSCIPLPHIYHPLSLMTYNNDGYLKPFLNLPQPTRRQDKPPLYARNGAAIYITRTDRLKEYIIGGNILPYIMDSAASLDVDTTEDLSEADRILRIPSF